LPGAVSRRRPRHSGCAVDRARGRASDGLQSEGARRPARLERPGANDESGPRPGQGTSAGPRSGRCRAGDPDGDEWREHEDLIDIVARAVPSERLDLDTLKDVDLFTRQGAVVPFSQVARVRYELEEPVLRRRNRDMAITVRADVKDGEQGVSVTQAIQPMLKDIEAKLPFGYRIDVGGAVEESAKANRALAAIAPVMIVTILAILMLQLQSFSRMAMVFLTAPLGLIGVVIVLLLVQAPLGFVAILGVVALSGMIMRNSVILIDQVQTEINEGRDSWNAVVDAAVHRTRP